MNKIYCLRCGNEIFMQEGNPSIFRICLRCTFAIAVSDVGVTYCNGMEDGIFTISMAEPNKIVKVVPNGCLLVAASEEI